MKALEWLLERTGAAVVWEALFARKVPEARGAVSWLYTLGSAALLVLVVQVLTGALLAMNYVPSPDHAYDSVRHVSERVLLGGFMRGLHRWGATFMVILATAHMLRAYFMGAYKYPREMTWLAGVALWLLVMVFGFTGYLLPWDQKAYWATAVGTNIAAQVPLVGPAIAAVLRGGAEMGAATLTRFYALHVLVLPILTGAILALHLFWVVWHGISEPPVRGDGGPPPADWRQRYRKRYASLKAGGLPFFPHIVFKDTVMAVLVFGALCGLGWFVGAELEDLADPTDATYNPRPEWYFMFLFQALKFFPGHLEAAAAVFLPGIAMAALVLVPFLDRGPRRHPLDRPLWTGLGALAIAVFAHLTWAGLRSPLTNPVVDKDPLVSRGILLYRSLKCAYCHSIKGEGGSSAPVLDKVAGEETADWLEKHFRDPRAVTPGSTMPKLNLLDEEIHALVAYMKSLGAGPYTPEAPKLFAENCAACHKIGKVGSDMGPDLSEIGAARDKAYLKRYILDPSKVNAASSMPGYQGQLTDVQVEDLARYLAGLRP